MDGAAVFAGDGTPANLRYCIECGHDWVSQRAMVTGWIGERSVDVALLRNADAWEVRGAPVASDVSGLSDIDLGFTPATNTNAIRRLNLDVGGESETIAVWFDVDNWAVKPLRQIYRRLAVHHFEYISPDNNYRAVLTVNGAGFVTDYPDLWVAQDASA